MIGDQRMTIVLTGGGSGGHITPILAVAAEIKHIRPDVKVVYIGQIGDQFADIPAKDPNFDQAFYVRAGKFRRYHGEGLRQLLDFSTMYLNIRDLFFVFIGIFQSRKLIKKIKPSIVFSRGGYVSVPVSLGAKIYGVRYITHDSDSIPSLANKLISPWATQHFVALPKDTYSYPQNKTVTTGIPLSNKIVPISEKLKQEYRRKLAIRSSSKFIFIIGGGLGAQSLNEVVADVMPNLMAEFKDLEVVHLVGKYKDDVAISDYKSKLSEIQLKRVKVLDYSDEAYLYSGAADIVITRAGATSLAEYAIQGKACIVVPSTVLTGGHQLKNAQILEKSGAVVVLNDLGLTKDPTKLGAQVSRLLNDKSARNELELRIHKFAKPNSTENIARRILDIAMNK
jgi:UDP-N-acetylglucosamine--N-acetylmuramyl-(pentapeptide) pyrophosphoryl-undecaprenol N-acetylglucosamine transferase